MIWLLLVVASLVSADHFIDKVPETLHYSDLERYQAPESKSKQHRYPTDESEFCIGKPDGNYALGRCEKKFLSCAGGVTTAQYCPDSLVFDPFLDRCEVAKYSPHCTKGRVQTTPMTSPMPTSAPRRKPHFSCRQKKDGLYADRLHPCRPYYFSCSNGEATVMHCPDQLFFDPELQQCDRFSNIPVCTGRPRPISKAPMQQKHSTPRPVRFNCRGKPSGNYPNPWSKRPFCSMIYFTCSNGFATERHCPRSLFYDPIKDVCDRFLNVYPCTGRKVVPTKPPVTTPHPTVPPVPFNCRGRKDGYYVNPRAECSATYYACSGGIARMMKCQYGLAFDPDTDTCQQPAVVRICGGIPPPKTEATKPPFRPVTKPPPIDCSGRPNGLYPDPLHRCSRIFYSCSNGLAIRMECPMAMAFDPKSKSCQLASETYICTGRHTTTMRPTRPPVTPKPVNFDCRSLPDGPYPNPRRLCSPYYYVCSNGYASKIVCPKGLFYDPHLKVCDIYSEIYACTGKRRKVTPAPNYRGKVRPCKEFDCRGLESGLYPVPGKRCSNHFFQCSNDLAYKMECEKGLFFDPEHRRCDRYQNIYACTGRRQPVYRPKKIKSKPRTEYQRIPIDCIQLGDGDHPEPGALYGRTYYSCFNGRGVRRQCPKGTFFHVVLRRCESLESLKAMHRNSVKPKVRQPPMDYRICAGQPDGSYPIAECSDVFVSCSGGVARKQHCSAGLYFDPERLGCDYQQHIPSCGGRRPKLVPQKPQKQPIYRPPPYDCTTLADGRYPWAPCSEKFVVCSGGQPRLEKCPAHLVFREEIDGCDYHYRTASCQRQQRKPYRKQYSEVEY